jgi:hypothetical protein
MYSGGGNSRARLAQSFAHLGGGLRALCSILRHRACDDARHRPGDLRLHFAG